MTEPPNIAPGPKIWFSGEKRPYTVRRSNDRYLICTKPFNLKRTVLYTIVDLKENVRGLDNYIFSPGYEAEEDIEKMWQLFLSGEVCASYFSRVPLVVNKIMI